ncbi:hypothetical protein PP742_gp64 [Alcaligenes phage vB_Af_QDWS595]|uniref:Uncharacterized protein n=1 Tax=Alcaligenes phage vB_Af_QDWS595 TaxID=2877946 RepID=A0AAE9C0J0_9CAUD|nr:hypothetical protein PP742_gp64 [Alcaligenes phage vB_Af_QDWS595]UCR75548.1 hypothetical protein vBAfaPQDWS595_64 [Alcaligenes phage vB_Af_QDWS595]
MKNSKPRIKKVNGLWGVKPIWLPNGAGKELNWLATCWCINKNRNLLMELNK